MIYDSGEVSLEHLLLSRNPSQRGARAHAPVEVMNKTSVEPTNPESITHETASASFYRTTLRRRVSSHASEPSALGTGREAQRNKTFDLARLDSGKLFGPIGFGVSHAELLGGAI